MHRVYFGAEYRVKNENDWIIFDCELDEVFSQLQTKYIDEFRERNENGSIYRANELDLYTAL
jgi:hypothetical protein